MPFRRGAPEPTPEAVAEGHTADKERGEMAPAPELVDERPLPADDGEAEGHRRYAR